MNSNKVPPLPYRPDSLCVEVLEAHLLRRLSSRIRDLAIVATAEGLILRGRARTYYDKQLAQHALMEVIATPILNNEIEVDSSN